MSGSRKPITVLVADDDEEDRGFIRKAWSKSRASNDLPFVEDGEKLTEYLNHTGRYSDPKSVPRPAVNLLDLNLPKRTGGKRFARSSSIRNCAKSPLLF